MGIMKTLASRMDEDPEYRASQRFYTNTMSIEIITHISEGRPWQSQQGTMYGHKLRFQSGLEGEANAKNTPPPYRVGDQVEVSITGTSSYGNKLKVQKPQQGGHGGAQNQYSAPGGQRQPPARNEGANAQGTPFLGVTVGMALNNGCAFALKEAEDPAGSGFMIGSPDFYKRIWEHASNILRLATVLEKGKLHPKPGETEEPEPEPEPVRQHAPASRAATRPQPGPGGSAFPTGGAGGDDDQIPFARFDPPI